jgi:hypothetical protein
VVVSVNTGQVGDGMTTMMIIMIMMTVNDSFVSRPTPSLTFPFPLRRARPARYRTTVNGCRDREVRSSNGRPLLVVGVFFFIMMTDPRHQELSFPIAMRYE